MNGDTVFSVEVTYRDYRQTLTVRSLSRDAAEAVAVYWAKRFDVATVAMAPSMISGVSVLVSKSNVEPPEVIL